MEETGILVNPNLEEQLLPAFEPGLVLRVFLSEHGQARTVSAVDAETVGGVESLSFIGLLRFLWPTLPSQVSALSTGPGTSREKIPSSSGSGENQPLPGLSRKLDGLGLLAHVGKMVVAWPVVAGGTPESLRTPRVRPTARPWQVWSPTEFPT
jgi:hypothetical protein